MLQTELLIGAAGWDNDKWVGGFYPQDLPEDWRFGYYTNRLRSVLVPASFWHARDIDSQIENMIEDLYPQFRMVLEWELSDNENALSEVQEFLEKTRPLDENVDAYLVSLAGTASATALQAIKLLQQQHPVCIAGHDEQIESVFAGLDEVSQCWDTASQAQPLARGRFLVALTDNTDPRAIREVIEKIDAWPEGSSSAQGAALFFDNEKAAETAFQARTIAELMGV